MWTRSVWIAGGVLLVAACGSSTPGSETALSDGTSSSVAPLATTTAPVSNATSTTMLGATSSTSSSLSTPTTSAVPASEPGSVDDVFDSMDWEPSGIAFDCDPERRRCTDIVIDPTGAPISYDPASRVLTRHVRHDGDLVSTTLPESLGDVYLVAGGPDDVVYLNSVTQPGAEGAADLVALAFGPGDAGREVGRITDGGNPGVDADFAVTPEGIVRTGWYGDGARPAPDEALVMAWVEADAADDAASEPDGGIRPTGIAAVTIDAYEGTVTVNERTWTLGDAAGEYPPTGMPRIAATFDGGFIARYDMVIDDLSSVVVRGWPDGAVEKWTVPFAPDVAGSIVPEPMGTVLVAHDDRYVRVAPFETARR